MISITNDAKFKAYLAGPIFTYGDLLRNTEWAAKIRKAFPNIDLYSPVENVDINGVEGKKKFAGSQLIADGDNTRLDNCDVLIACIDGDVLPSGTCAEIGKFHEKIMRGDNKFLIGICTDNRQCALTHSAAKDEGGASRLGEQQYSYQNLYVTGLLWQCSGLVYTIDEVIEKLDEWLRNRDYDYCKCPEMEQSLKSQICTHDDCEWCDGCQDEVEVELYNKAQEAVQDYLDYKTTMLWKSKFDNVKSINECDGEVFHYVGEVRNDR